MSKPVPTNPVPQQVVDQIKQNISLVDYVQSRGIKLTKSGKEYKGLCPFHSDRHPSLSVNPVMNLFICFGCDAKGDIIEFVMRLDKLSFREAVKQLSNGKLSTQPSNSTQFFLSAAEPLTPPSQLFQHVFDYYHKTFFEDQRGLKYLQNKRGITSPQLFKTIKVGFANGTLLSVLSVSDKPALKGSGLLDKNGREHFHECVVFPLFDLQGNLIRLFGRSIQGKKLVNMPGEMSGLFYPPKECETIILTEGIIDALTLLNAGYRNTLAIYGVNGFTNDHETFLKQQRVKQVILCLDGDKSGKKAIPRLKEKIERLGIEVCSVQLPDGLDINEYFQIHSKDAFDRLLTGIFQKAGKSNDPKLQEIEGGFTYRLNSRDYRILWLDTSSMARMKVNLKVSCGKEFYVDTLDLLCGRPREIFIKKAALLLGLEEGELHKELNVLIDLLEIKRIEMRYSQDKTNQESKPMTAEEKAEAMAFLTSKKMEKIIVDDILKCGCIGEEAAKLFCYFATYSRFLPKPLGVNIVAGSGTGKSQLQDSICMLVLPEDLKRYTRITGQSLFYKEETELKYKVLAIAEELGAEDALYSIRILQSEQKLNVAVTITDPQTGQKKTDESRTEGPTMIFLTTSNPDSMDFETRNRFCIIMIDESREQTRRILKYQRSEDSLTGVLKSSEIDKIVRKHHNAQRLLGKVKVVNPYSEELTYPDDKLMVRREQKKYLTLIKTIAFLRQYQKKIKKAKNSFGEEIEYIEVSIEDIELANKLACEILGQSLSDLAPHTISLLKEIKRFVDKRCKKSGQNFSSIRFTRREVCEFSGLSYWHVRPHLELLVEMEYLLLHSGGQGKLHRYELLWHGEGLDGNRFFMGLIDVKNLKNKRK